MMNTAPSAIPARPAESVPVTRSSGKEPSGLLATLFVCGAGCGTQDAGIDTGSSGEAASPHTGSTQTSHAPSQEPRAAVVADASAAVRHALLTEAELPADFVKSPDPARGATSHLRSQNPDCSAALAQLDSAAADTSVLATTADRASAYFTRQDGEVTISHSVARYEMRAYAAQTWATLTWLPAHCARWTETDDASQPTTLSIQVTNGPAPEEPDVVAFMVRIAATGGIAVEKRIEVAAARVGQDGRTVELLARTSNGAAPIPPEGSSPAVLLATAVQHAP